MLAIHSTWDELIELMYLRFLVKWSYAGTYRPNVYVRGNRPIISTIFYHFHIYIGDFDYNHTTVDEERFFQPSVLQVVHCILLLHIFAPSIPCYFFQFPSTIILFCNLHLKMLFFLFFLYKYFLQHCYSLYVK